MKDRDRLVCRLLDNTRAGKLEWKHISNVVGEAYTGPPPVWEQTCLLEMKCFTLYIHRINPQSHVLGVVCGGNAIELCASAELKDESLLKSLYDSAIAPTKNKIQQLVLKTLDSLGDES